MIGWSVDVMCDLHRTRGGVEKRRFFLFSLKTSGDGLSVVCPQNHYDNFFDLSFKINVGVLVIWASKSPRRFLDLCLKIKVGRVVKPQLTRLCLEVLWEVSGI
jgi:hypothetical protein